MTCEYPSSEPAKARRVTVSERKKEILGNPIPPKNFLRCGHPHFRPPTERVTMPFLMVKRRKLETDCLGSFSVLMPAGRLPVPVLLSGGQSLTFTMSAATVLSWVDRTCKLASWVEHHTVRLFLNALRNIS